MLGFYIVELPYTGGNCYILSLMLFMWIFLLGTCPAMRPLPTPLAFVTDWGKAPMLGTIN